MLLGRWGVWGLKNCQWGTSVRRGFRQIVVKTIYSLIRIPNVRSYLVRSGTFQIWWQYYAPLPHPHIQTSWNRGSSKIIMLGKGGHLATTTEKKLETSVNHETVKRAEIRLSFGIFFICAKRQHHTTLWKVPFSFVSLLKFIVVTYCYSLYSLFSHTVFISIESKPVSYWSFVFFVLICC